VTPDEFRYWTMAEGHRVPRPFHYRWLLPALLRQNRRAWLVAQWVSLLVLAGLVSYESGLWWAGVLLFGCSGLTVNLKHPVLVDLPALALAYGSAVAWNHDQPVVALALVVIASSVKETAPLFAAAFALTPMLLIGLLPVCVRHLQRSGPDPVPPGPATEALEHPVRVSWEHHRKLPAWAYVLPWGVLLAALVDPSAAVLVPLGLAYLQLVVATDTVRLYQWAAPALAVAAAPVLGPWVLPALLVHLVNPFRTEGF